MSSSSQNAHQISGPGINKWAHGIREKRQIEKSDAIRSVHSVGAFSGRLVGAKEAVRFDGERPGLGGLRCIDRARYRMAVVLRAPFVLDKNIPVWSLAFGDLGRDVAVFTACQVAGNALAFSLEAGGVLGGGGTDVKAIDGTTRGATDAPVGDLPVRGLVQNCGIGPQSGEQHGGEGEELHYEGVRRFDKRL